MRRALAGLAMGCVVGCSAPELPPRSAPEPPPPSLPAPEPPSPHLPCRTVRLPLEGLSACMPGEPKEWTSKSADASEHGLVASIDLDRPSVAARFTVSRLRELKATAPRTKVSPPEWHHVDVSRELEVDGFSALEIEGLSTPKEYSHARAITIGDSLYLATVVHAPGTRVDPAVVKAFLQSFHAEVPWRIHASPAEGFTLAVPAIAIVRETAEPNDGGRQTKVNSFLLGGVDEQVFVVAVSTFMSGEKRTADEILGDSARALVGRSGAAILDMREIRPGGRRGRELLVRSRDGSYMRTRLVVAPRRFYVLGLSAKRVEVLSGPDATRFFESLQIASP